MEEDIKILENLQRDILKACECSLTSSSDKKQWVKEAQAIRNLINRYKEQEKHIKALDSVVVEHMKRNKEQEKIIELMAKDIAEHKIDEDICRQVKDPNNEDCYDTLYYDNACSDCVIEYYEKKARENND